MAMKSWFHEQEGSVVVSVSMVQGPCCSSSRMMSALMAGTSDVRALTGCAILRVLSIGLIEVAPSMKSVG